MIISDYQENGFSSSAPLQQLVYTNTKALNLPSLKILIAKGVMKVTAAELIAGSGLNLLHLKAIYSRKGEDGLRDTFQCPSSSGKPRVTSNKRVLNDVIPKLIAFFYSST